MYLDRHRESIVAWVKDGLSDAVIAGRVRVSPSTVRYWRERNGVKRPPPAFADLSARSRELASPLTVDESGS